MMLTGVEQSCRKLSAHELTLAYRHHSSIVGEGKSLSKSSDISISIPPKRSAEEGNKAGIDSKFFCF